LASEAVQLESNGVDASSGPQAQTGAPTGSYKVVSNAAADKARSDELYSFRAAITAAEPQPDAQLAKPISPLRPILMIGALGVALVALVVVLFHSFPSLSQQKPPALYVDLGNRRFDPAGLAGRLIVRWDKKAAYELYLDPVDQQDTSNFQALAQDPSHPLAVVIRLLNTAGTVACEKEIDFPAPAQPGAPSEPAPALMPTITAGGDTIRDLAGPDGQIAELTTSGPLPCGLGAYQSIATWDFAANYPAVADQQDEAKQGTAKSSSTGSRRSRLTTGWRLTAVRFQRLPAPIEGDDVIVGDNPARGTVDTSSGREFLIGGGGAHARSSEWQIFPSAIHFRCEKTGVCTLTRYSSRSIVQARLVQ
jgi:hypothetical protein